jgi:hypothetical protein
MGNRHPAPKPGAAKRLARLEIFKHLDPVKAIGIGKQLRKRRKHLGLAVDPVKQDGLWRKSEVDIHSVLIPIETAGMGKSFSRA